MDNNQNNKCRWCGNDKNNCRCRIWVKKIVGIIIVLLALGLIANHIAKTFANDANPRTISITGIGEVSTVPDVSTISFTIRSTDSSNDTESLQNEVAESADSVIAKLKDLGIDEKDIQTSNYSVNPKYNYPNGVSTIAGYEASESIDVKVRNTDNVSKVLNILAEEKITEVYGPNFEVDDVQKVKDQARDLAIQDAKDKADILAKSLGVKIKRIVGYSDDTGNNIPVPPIAYSSVKVMNQAAGSARDANIQTGQQKVTSNVTITFQIED